MSFQRPHPLVLIATVLIVALTISLGVWQLGRGQHKTALAQRVLALDSAPISAWQGELGDAVWGRRFQFEGVWQPQGQIYLDNRILNGRPGYFVLSPLKLANGQLLLINRGWLPRVQGREPQAPLAASAVRVLVRLQSPQQRYVTLSGSQVSGAVWQNLDWARYKQVTAAPLVAALAYQLSRADDGLSRDWPAPDAGADKHYAYAGQWFLFSGLAVVLFVFLHWKSRK